MAKKTNQEIAEAYFEKNKEANEIHICGGFEFKTKNAAELHKNTSTKKGLKVCSFERKEVAEAPTTEPKAKALDKMNKPELQQVAKNLDIRFEENDTKAQLIEQITKVKETKIIE